MSSSRIFAVLMPERVKVPDADAVRMDDRLDFGQSILEIAKSAFHPFAHARDSAAIAGPSSYDVAWSYREMLIHALDAARECHDLAGQALLLAKPGVRVRGGTRRDRTTARGAEHGSL
jgi:hypothetical protein